MADKKLKQYVTVGSDTYGPDDDVPPEVLKQIDNPAVFEDADLSTPAEQAAQKLSKQALDSNLKPQAK